MEHTDQEEAAPMAAGNSPGTAGARIAGELANMSEEAITKAIREAIRKALDAAAQDAA